MSLETEKATDKINESVRDLLNLKVTVPLGNPNLQLLHTNRFCYVDLPSTFELANMNRIGDALSSSRAGRYSGYDKGRWYIEGITVTNDGSSAKMELDLNPFGTNMNKYIEGYESYINAYDDAHSSNSGSGKVTSTKGDNSSFKGGEGKVIDELVHGIIGDETNNLKKAKLIHKWLQKNAHYKFYKNSKTSTPTQAYNRMKSKGINCADTSRLTASMMRSAGVDCYVVHSTCHYYTVIKYKGKLYCSDATSKRRGFNTYWRASSCHNGSTAKFQGKSSYGKKCGGNPCT